MDIIKLCLDSGAEKAEELSVNKLILMPELRELCKQNLCGMYGRNYACPPSVGEIDELIAKLKEFNTVVIFQNIYMLEDSFDFEGMMESQANHDSITRRIANELYKKYGRENVLVLGAGACSLCEKCGIQTNEICRNPDIMLSSLEAYGINVSKIEEISNMKYINGIDTVTYFSGIFYNLPD